MEEAGAGVVIAAGAFGALAEEIREGIARLEGAGSEEAEQALLMKFFYGTMPLSDAADGFVGKYLHCCRP